ncbi:regulator of the sigma(E) factor [[Clostridium] sordellii]|uniref:SoxR reducing system RseC family protein n=1 Tax=Paraclostridium sordellii TaxID=1505 RepID=UPI0005E10B45|nr:MULTISPECIES: SoxR reducing system RseC family protein [Paeniclostridium]MBS6024039.1 SoxR reducing system RseC family protein [Paeniclostridium sordellii]MBW4861774.1 SoxR reducing system RseC family protein [Paeniclostridium sp.]MBW4874904.1 SoxR reducing system RseC family protein [Paeniclostridium sp.]MBX9182470.1 SoxR reducing system RseC family protein [Paeniclostridium sordellii]MCH1967477.1 SoxR reducing system RseC family protein [Paeniclostridium sordellii]
MNQRGYIIELVDGTTAKIKMQKHSACAACGKCASSTDKKDIIVEVDNNIGAKVGDYVEVNMDSVNVIKAAAIVYIVPLIALLGGTIVSYGIFNFIDIGMNKEVLSGFIGIVLTIISYLLIKSKDRKFRESRNYIPIITKVINTIDI